MYLTSNRNYFGYDQARTLGMQGDLFWHFCIRRLRSLITEPFVYRTSKGGCSIRPWLAPTASCNLGDLKSGTHQTHASHLVYFPPMPIGWWKVGSDWRGFFFGHRTPISCELWVPNEVQCRRWKLPQGSVSHFLGMVSARWSICMTPKADTGEQLPGAYDKGRYPGK